MSIKKILKNVIFIYECIRLVLLGFTAIIIMRQSGTSSALWMAISSAALFPLMALFIMIGASRYKNYLPLYISGKVIGAAAFLGWSIIYGKTTMDQWMYVSGDFFALAAAIYLLKEDD